MGMGMVFFLYQGLEVHLEHLECSRQNHIQGRGAEAYPAGRMCAIVNFLCSIDDDDAPRAH